MDSADPMIDMARLVERMLRVEALFAGATTEGERTAAENARERIRARLDRLRQQDPPVEYRFSMTDRWSRALFLGLLRRYGINPFRYPGQRHTTVMARVSKRFVDETLWPTFEELNRTLQGYLEDVTQRVIAQAVHPDCTEAPEVAALPPAS